MNFRHLSPNVRGALFALGAFSVFSSHDVLVKLLGGTYSPIQVVFFSVLFSFPILTLLLVRSKTESHMRPKHPWWSLARAIAAIITGFCAFTAFSLLPLAQTYALLFATPLLITVLSIPMLGEKVGTHRWIAVIVGLIGVIVVLRPGSAPFSAGHLAGLLAACGSATASIIVRKIGQEERSSVLILFPLLGNVMVMGALLPSVYKPMPIEHLGALAAIAVLSITATSFIIFAYRTGEAAVVAPMQYSQIIWASLFGWLFFSEVPDIATVVGAGIVIASGMYIVVREGGARSDDNQPVLSTKTRYETGTYPRVSSLMEDE
ncbi:DMT family transporter [Meridianimarinicoccus aquatilis]|uniref:DMT family transporter n=1 Tax=Meridianimarinicoccus aquatilis TaxID=2552766 RepID=A0A4R6B3L4_9RHOB|nr:DMT family transporter [Fluviibacterium aquatile]QIE40924.1 DMT family transporter [Rhodobacteraceae bacterium SC52]TDL89233.1 DMT family transporter [Fluviibacterium aquatile]